MNKIEQAVAAIYHASFWVMINALTSATAWRADDQAGVIYGVAMAVFLVAPGAIAAWFLREGLNFRSWLSIALGFWVVNGVTLALCHLLGIYALLSKNRRTVEIFVLVGMLCLQYSVWRMYRSGNPKREQAEIKRPGVRPPIESKSTVDVPMVSGGIGAGTRGV